MGERYVRKEYYCSNCNKKLSCNVQTGLCIACFNKLRVTWDSYEDMRKKNSYKHKGENNPNWRGGISKTLKDNFCLDCNKRIVESSIKCLSCNNRSRVGNNHPFFGKKHTEESKSKTSRSMKKWFLDENYVKKMYMAWRKKPNKSELELLNMLDALFPGEYIYVGDFQFWLGGKNPDFMNINGKKKLIELFGDYWHRNKKPDERINHFKQYGFDTLVVWENELKNKEYLECRIKAFNGKEGDKL